MLCIAVVQVYILALPSPVTKVIELVLLPLKLIFQEVHHTIRLLPVVLYDKYYVLGYILLRRGIKYYTTTKYYLLFFRATCEMLQIRIEVRLQYMDWKGLLRKASGLSNAKIALGSGVTHRCRHLGEQVKLEPTSSQEIYDRHQLDSLKSLDRKTLTISVWKLYAL